MSLPSSGELSKSNDVVSDKFPVGLRVLAVDDDPTCLKILEKMLKTCRYEVTKCNQAQDALKLLRENKDGFDIVMSDVYMPDMDGLALLERVGLEMDLPVIMMSADDSLTVVMNGVKHGACDYLIKPIRMEALKTIWQHVLRKKGHQLIDVDDFLDGSVSLEDEEEQQQPQNGNDSSSGDEVGPGDNPRKRRAGEEVKVEEEEENGNANASSTKTQRVVWSSDLHREFVKAVNDLGIDKAVPKKILEKMNVPGLKRENVASHLQKYRIYLRKMMKERQQRGNLFDDSFKIPPDFAYGSKFQAHNTHFTDHNSMIRSSSMLSTGNMNTSNNVQVDQQQNMQSWETFRPSLSQSSNMYAAPPPSSSSSLLRQNDFASPQIGQSRTHMLNEVEHNRLLSQGLHSNFLDQYGISSNRHLPASSAQPSTYSRAHFQDYPQIHDSRFTTPLASNYGPGLSNSSRAPVLQEPNQFVSVETSSNMPNGFIANYDGFNPETTSRHGGEAIVSQQLTSLSLVDNNASRANVDAMLMADVGFDNDFISFPDNLCHDELMISALLSQQEAPGPVESYLGPNLPQQQH